MVLVLNSNLINSVLLVSQAAAMMKVYKGKVSQHMHLGLGARPDPNDTEVTISNLQIGYSPKQGRAAAVGRNIAIQYNGVQMQGKVAHAFAQLTFGDISFSQSMVSRHGPIPNDALATWWYTESPEPAVFKDAEQAGRDPHKISELLHIFRISPLVTVDHVTAFREDMLLTEADRAFDIKIHDGDAMLGDISFELLAQARTATGDEESWAFVFLDNRTVQDGTGLFVEYVDMEDGDEDEEGTVIVRNDIPSMSLRSDPFSVMSIFDNLSIANMGLEELQDWAKTFPNDVLTTSPELTTPEGKARALLGGAEITLHREDCVFDILNLRWSVEDAVAELHGLPTGVWFVESADDVWLDGRADELVMSGSRWLSAVDHPVS